MIANHLLQFFSALVFIWLVCLIIYNITLPLILKTLDLSLKSDRFRTGICVFLALIFCVVGAMQLIDFVEETGPASSRFFPLSFLTAGVFAFLGLMKRHLD